jgi:hypothetical protein
VAGIFFAPAWILFEDRKLHPYLTDRSINDLQIPVKNNTSDEAGVAEVAGVQELQNGAAALRSLDGDSSTFIGSRIRLGWPSVRSRQLLLTPATPATPELLFSSNKALKRRRKSGVAGVQELQNGRDSRG